MSGSQYRRNSLRYPGYDYSQSGSVFVTICTHNRQCLFGTVSHGAVSLSPAGERVATTWNQLAQRFPDIIMDESIVMPDHLHGIIMTGANPDVTGANTVGFVINSFKNSITAAWRKSVALHGWPQYKGHLWHPDYYDRIIRNEPELSAVREYIAANPARWEAKRRQEG